MAVVKRHPKHGKPCWTVQFIVNNKRYIESAGPVVDAPKKTVQIFHDLKKQAIKTGVIENHVSRYSRLSVEEKIEILRQKLNLSGGNTMGFKVDKGIPIPPILRHGRVSAASKYTKVISKMEDGDSVPFTTRKDAEKFVLAIRMRKGFATLRKMSDGSFRVWKRDNDPQQPFKPYTATT